MSIGGHQNPFGGGLPCSGSPGWPGVGLPDEEPQRHGMLQVYILSRNIFYEILFGGDTRLVGGVWW